MYKLFKNWGSLLFILTFLSISSKSEASHVLGGEISYQHIGGDTFLVKSKIYRNCRGILLSNIQLVVTPKGKSAIFYTTTLTGGFDITPLCKTALRICEDDSLVSHTRNIGVEEYLIEHIVVLPDCEYIISLTQCCRNGDITTGASGQQYYNEVSFNKCIAGITNAPTFIAKPYILGCINQCTTVLQGAIGNVGDSLVYKLGYPMSDPNSTVPYNTGYSNDAPFKYQGYPDINADYDFPQCNGVHLNSATGELNFKVTDSDLTVMVILVEQWRKDTTGIYQKVSTIRRDATLSLVNCPPNRQPMINGIDSTKATEIHICAKDTSAFTIYVKDDATDTVTVKLTGNVPDSVLTLSSAKQQNVFFKWVPEENHVSALPYWFVIRAEDNICPVPSYLEKFFKVYVHSALSDVEIKTQKINCDDKYTFSSGISNKSGLNFLWKINDSIVSTDTALTYNFSGKGKHVISLKVANGNCSKSAFDSVIVNEKPFINKNFTNTICKGDTINLEGFAAHNFTWKPAIYVSSATGNIVRAFPDKTTTFYLSGKDTVTNCVKTDSITIIVDTTCVWPGDANLDKSADYLDILDIALGYSATGIPRVNASIDWKPQRSADWRANSSNGNNYKHLDTNGDSIIDADDTFAVAKNYGKTHLKNEEPELTGNPNDPPLYFQFNKKYYLGGDTVKAALYLGNEDKPVKDIYGLGLKHFFANPYMQPNSYSFTWNCEMLCGAQDNFQLYRQFNDKGTGEGSIIRTDKLTTSKPFGKVADVEFILQDSTFSYPQTGTNISLEILRSRLIDMNGNEIPVYTKADAVKVYRTQNDVVGIQENTNTIISSVSIYPNPANSILNIVSANGNFTEIAVINALGKTVLAASQKANNATLNIQNLSPGVYFVMVKLNDGYSRHKIIVAR